MSTHDYLQGLLDSQELTARQSTELESHKNEITKFLREEFGTDPVIKYAGSLAKGTVISESYDLDIVCYFPDSDERSLKDIREDVSTRLAERYVLEEKNSAERIRNLRGANAPANYHIDVVPGRFISGTKDVFIHLRQADRERMQTNLKTHIDYIANSGCINVIRLVKLWAYRNHLSIKTFVLELFVVENLKGYENKANLRLSFLKVLNEMEDNFDTTQLTDPANTNNVVSRLVSATDKSLVADTASNTLRSIEGSSNLADWQAVFGEGGNIIPTIPNLGPATPIINPSGPWAQ